MQLLGDTRIYQEGGISPPCMVLLQSEQQEESACVLLVNGEVPRRSGRGINLSDKSRSAVQFYPEVGGNEVQTLLTVLK